MAIKPWYKVITPREDLCEGKPLDAAEFAVHLDQVRDGRAREDYQDPERFFQRTYLTRNMRSIAAECIRRLSGEVTETSAIFNLASDVVEDVRVGRLSATHGRALLRYENNALWTWRGRDDSVARMLEAEA